MDDSRRMNASDEEDDLEALRLVALRSLKKPPAANPSFSQNVNTILPTCKVAYKFRGANRKYGNHPHGKGRFFNGRETAKENSVVYSNLISLTPRDSIEYATSKQQTKTDSVFLPQSRYNSNSQQEAKGDKASSKFDRYRDTDKSEDEDSEEETLKMDSDDELCKLERADSLEALMQELDDEIQGKAKSKEIDETPSVVDSESEQKNEPSTSESEDKKYIVVKSEELGTSNEQLIEKVDQPTSEQTEPVAIKENNNSNKAIDNSSTSESALKKRRHNIPFQRNFRGIRGRHRDYKPTPHLFKQQYLPQNGAMHHFPNLQAVFPNPQFGPPPIIVNSPPFFDMPLPPLRVDTTQNLPTQMMAPLSPRSAAFVLQNRAIIEKRKRSPRRTYSRSPSPRNRSRSISPRNPLATPRRRSLSPRKRSTSPRRRSLTPIRNRSPPLLRKSSPILMRKRSPSPLKKRSRSPRRRSITPKKRSSSPKRRPLSPRLRNSSPKSRPFSPKRRSASPKKRSTSPRKREIKDSENGSKNKLSIRDRLGFKNLSKSEEKLALDKSNVDRSPQKDVKLFTDPVLEARKKKFESKEMKVREGVIRLKPKDDAKSEESIEKECVKAESPKEVEPVAEHAITTKMCEVVKELMEVEPLNEDILLQDDALELDAHLDLFSEEDSDNEKKSFFKAKEISAKTCESYPSSKLINGEKNEKTKHIKDSKGSRSNESSGINKRKRREISPVNSTKRSRTTQSPRADKSVASKKLGVKSERHPKKFDRKIEIKIKNPSKYERADKLDDAKEIKVEKHRKQVKEEIQQNNNDDDEDHALVIENLAESEIRPNDEGDLRAQLSKKRAEKLNKHISRKGVTSRLLQNALENALPIKKHKKSKSKELTSSADGKLPIHLRLGLACGSEIFTKTKRKSKNRKSDETEHQPQEFELRRFNVRLVSL
uniref:Uncharacterized protein n=1 Tax=Dendroctonus ponderosae TaxID=77166 RepID=A0AAR5PXS4_DENPD